MKIFDHHFDQKNLGVSQNGGGLVLLPLWEMQRQHQHVAREQRIAWLDAAALSVAGEIVAAGDYVTFHAVLPR